jgi:hypothetical protein
MDAPRTKTGENRARFTKKPKKTSGIKAESTKEAVAFRLKIV